MTDSLYVSDAEIGRRLGVGEKTWRVALSSLEKRPGFPPKTKIFGGRRYWPAVQAFLNQMNGLSVDAPMVPDGKEVWPHEQAKNRRRSRPRMAGTG